MTGPTYLLDNRPDDFIHCEQMICPDPKHESHVVLERCLVHLPVKQLFAALQSMFVELIGWIWA